MATPQQLKRIQQLVWVLIYSGLLTLVIGISTLRADAELGSWLVSGGAVAMAIGVLLIYLRSRLRADPPDPSPKELP